VRGDEWWVEWPGVRGVEWWVEWWVEGCVWVAGLDGLSAPSIFDIGWERQTGCRRINFGLIRKMFSNFCKS